MPYPGTAKDMLGQVPLYAPPPPHTHTLTSPPPPHTHTQPQPLAPSRAGGQQQAGTPSWRGAPGMPAQTRHCRQLRRMPGGCVICTTCTAPLGAQLVREPSGKGVVGMHAVLDVTLFSRNPQKWCGVVCVLYLISSYHFVGHACRSESS